MTNTAPGPDAQSPSETAATAHPRPGADWSWRLDGGLAAILAGIALLVFRYQLGAEQIWLDEGFLFTDLGSSLVDSMYHISGDVHPPLFYVVMWVSVMLGLGDLSSITGFRMPAMVFGVAFIPVFYALARLAVGWRWAAVAVLALILHPFYVSYAQEARMYTFLLLMLGLMLLGAVLILRYRAWLRQPLRPWIGRAVKTPDFLLGCVLFIACGTAAFLTHYTGLLSIAAAGAVILTLSLDRGSRLNSLYALRNSMILGGGILVLSLPWLVIAGLFQWGRHYGKHWVPAPEPSLLLDTLTETLLGDLWSRYADFWVIPVLGLAAFGLWRGRRLAPPLGVAMIGWMSFGLLAIFLIFSALIQPVLLPRTILPALPFFILAVTLALAALPRPVSLPAAVALIAALGFGLADYYPRQLKHDWSLFVAPVRAGDTHDAYIQAGLGVMMEFYLQDPEARARVIDIEGDEGWQQIDALPAGSRLLFAQRVGSYSADIQAIVDRLYAQSRVVERQEGGGAPRYGPAEIVTLIWRPDAARPAP